MTNRTQPRRREATNAATIGGVDDPALLPLLARERPIEVWDRRSAGQRRRPEQGLLEAAMRAICDGVPPKARHN